MLFDGGSVSFSGCRQLEMNMCFGGRRRKNDSYNRRRRIWTVVGGKDEGGYVEDCW